MIGCRLGVCFRRARTRERVPLLSRCFSYGWCGRSVVDAGFYHCAYDRNGAKQGARVLVRPC